jgi:hypothetical protein
MSAEKKDHTNKLTTDAGLTFNVNTMRKQMISFFKNQDLYFSVKGENDEVTKKLPMFKGSQVALAAALEQLTKTLLTNVLQFTNKDKSGLRTVTRPMLIYSVCLNKGLNQYYNYRLTSFNKNQVYKDQLPFKEDDVNQLMAGVDKKLMFTPKAFNFLCFLLLEAYLDIMSTGYQFILFADKRSLGPDAVLAAIKNKFPDSISHELCHELTRACNAVGKDLDAGEEGEAEDAKEEPAPAPAAKKTAPTKGKGKTAPIEEEDEDGDGDDDDDEPEEKVVVTKSSKKSTKETAPSSGSSDKKTRKTRGA